MTIHGPFVGRRLELGQLRAWLAEARASRGAVALVSGELGIGKTRLVDELAASAAECDTLTVRGRWYESRELPADIGMREVLLQLVANDRVRSALDTSDQYIPELVRLGPDFEQALGREQHTAPRGEAEPYRLWRAVLSLLRSACAVAPVLLILDDLQWGDAPSLSLLSFLGNEIGALPILIVGTYRPEDLPAGHPLHHAIGELVRAQTLRTIRLQGLSPEEVAEVAAAISGSTVSPDVASLLYRQTRGNALFVGEVVRHLMRTELDGKSPLVHPARGELEVPEELREVIAKRLATLSDACQRLLAQASVLGREFDVSVIGRIGEQERGDLLKAVDEAVRGAAVQEVAPGRFAFAHPLVRSVVYRRLLPSDRLATHLSAAEALEAEFGPSAGVYAREIARHLIAAGSLASPQNTVKYCLQGALQARASFALDEARSLLEGGLEACDRLSGPNGALRAQLLVELGYAEAGLGHPDRAIQVYREALVASERLGDAARALDARRWLASALARYGRWADVLDVTSDALATATEERSYPYVGLAGSHALALVLTGQAREAEHWVPVLLRLAFDGETRAVASHTAAGWSSWGLGDHGDASRHFRRARRCFLESGLDATAAQVALDHAIVAYFHGEFRASTAADHEAERLAAETLRVNVLADLYGFRSLASVHRGDWEQAAEQRERSREIAAGLGGSTRYAQLLERGEALEELWRNGPAAVAGLLRASSPLRNEPLLAALLARAGQRDAALQLADAVLGATPADGRGLVWLSLALPLTSTLCTLEDPRAEEWVASLSRYTGSSPFTWSLADIELARVHALAKRWSEAEHHFEVAARLCQEHRLRPFSGLVDYRRARMLLARRGAGDRHKAQLLLARAEAVFEELGLDYLRDQARELRLVPARGRPTRLNPAGLTAQESNVLQLLARGKSNREIANALFVSERTVGHHLENVYRKLGVASRNAAVAVALAEGYLPGTSN